MAWLLLPLVPLAAICDWAGEEAALGFLGEIGMSFLRSPLNTAPRDALRYFTKVAPEVVEELSSKGTGGAVSKLVAGGESATTRGTASSGIRGAIGKFIGNTVEWVTKAGRKIKDFGHTIKSWFHFRKRDVEGIDELEPTSYDAAFYGLKEIFAEMKRLQVCCS